MLTSIAHAFGAPDPSTGESSNIFMQFIPLVIMLAIFYFLLIRPQQKRTKLHKVMLQSLKKGDHILTTGGLIGRITELDGDTISIDLGQATVQVNRAYIVGLVDQKGSLTKEEK